MANSAWKIQKAMDGAVKWPRTVSQAGEDGVAQTSQVASLTYSIHTVTLKKSAFFACPGHFVAFLCDWNFGSDANFGHRCSKVTGSADIFGY
jgi:hypothetical protein